ncbi:MAG: cyclic nucleotide-binding domain-containing protein [Acidimicrobiia bacterium]|nr:cyclic nucleotide-binding domain-containing protein [Acidimicrobiia bacterium]
MTRSTHLDHLASVSLFSNCSRKELEAVERASDQLTLPQGKVLCEQGASGREAFVILEGTADVERNGIVVATLTSGACVGELAILDHGPRTATVRATTDLEVLVLGAREFASLVDDVGPIAHKLLKSLATRIRDLDSQTYD